MKAMRSEAADTYALVFNALAHSARRRILMSLNFAGGRMSAGKVASLFGHAWPTTTRHLQCLEDAGLVRHERVGRARIYELRPDKLRLAEEWLNWFGRNPLTAEERENDREHVAKAVPPKRRGRRS